MRNLALIDAVVALHEIARTVEIEVGQGQLSEDIRKCADRLHHLSIDERQWSLEADDVIKKAKGNDIQ
jgi:hypothetical protein